jgi:TPR repeat protein
VRYVNGAGVPKDEGRAAAYFASGCDAHEGTSCFLLATIVLSTGSNDETFRRVVALFRSSCDFGYADACSALGLAHVQGELGLKSDPTHGADLLEAGCERGSASGCATFAALVHDGRGRPKDAARAEGILTKACHDGSGEACGRLGGYLIERGDRERGLDDLRRACRLGLRLACDAITALTKKESLQ